MALGRKTGGRKPGTPNKRKLSPKARRQVDAYLARTADKPVVTGFKATPTGLDMDHPDDNAGLALLEALRLTYGAQLAQFIGQIAKGHRDEQGNLQARPINEMLHTIVAIGPRDTVEAMLAAQMASVHDAVMTQAAAARASGNLLQVDSATNALNKLSRTFACQVEALNKYRSKGEQKVTVVHIHEGAQAVVGDVHHGVVGGGGKDENGGQPHESERMLLSGSEAMLGNVETLGLTVSSAGSDGLERLPVPRRTGRGSAR